MMASIMRNSRRADSGVVDRQTASQRRENATLEPMRSSLLNFETQCCWLGAIAGPDQEPAADLTGAGIAMAACRCCACRIAAATGWAGTAGRTCGRPARRAAAGPGAARTGAGTAGSTGTAAGTAGAGTTRAGTAGAGGPAPGSGSPARRAAAGPGAARTSAGTTGGTGTAAGTAGAETTRAGTAGAGGAAPASN